MQNVFGEKPELAKETGFLNRDNSTVDESRRIEQLQEGAAGE